MVALCEDDHNLTVSQSSAHDVMLKIEVILCLFREARIQTDHTTPEEFENGGSTLKRIKFLQSTLCGRNLKTEQSPVILDLC